MAHASRAQVQASLDEIVRGEHIAFESNSAVLTPKGRAVIEKVIPALKRSPEAITYLKKRGLTGEIAARFALGYAPDGWTPLQHAAMRGHVEVVAALIGAGADVNERTSGGTSAL